MLKRIALILCMMSMLLILTGCEAAWVKKTNLEQAMGNRAALNLELINRLVNSGLLSEDAAKGMRESLERLKENPSSLNPNQSISWYLNTSIGEWSTEPTQDSTFPKSNAPTGNSGRDIPDSEIKPLDIIAANQWAQLNALMTCKVYVLKEQPGQPVNTDEIKGLLEAAKTKTGSEQEEAFNALVSKGYFKDSGKYLTDPNDPKNQMVIVTKRITETESVPVRDSKNNIIGHVTVKRNYVNEMGYDLVVCDKDNIPVATLRFREINKEAVDKLLGAGDAPKDKFLVDIKNKRAFLLEYPAYYISSVSIDKDGNYKTSFSESDLLVNLLSGKIKDKSGKELKQSENIQEVYGNNGAFVIYGTGDIKDVGFKHATVKGGTIVLRDYLELSYMPGVVNGEDFVTLGRRVRINDFEGSKQTVFANFINKKGEVMKDTPNILISHLMDIDSGVDGKAIKLGIVTNTDEKEGGGQTGGNQQGSTGQSQGNQENSNNTGDENDTGLLSDANINRALLKPVYKESIKPTTRFPGEKVGTASLSSLGDKMIFYGMAIDMSPFESGLYNGWIMRDDLEVGSLTWWNRWLNTKELDYGYSIDPEILRQFFMGNYSFDIMKRENTIIFNLETIAKIQQGYNEEDKARNVNYFRTLFAGLGILLIAYAIVLMAAWVFDVNLITGPKLMSVLTFGKWEAVSSHEELPNMELGEKHYMTFEKTLNNCIVIICIGVVLLFVDVVAIVKQLIEIFGGVGEWIGKTIFNRM